MLARRPLQAQQICCQNQSLASKLAPTGKVRRVFCRSQLAGEKSHFRRKKFVVRAEASPASWLPQARCAAILQEHERLGLPSLEQHRLAFRRGEDSVAAVADVGHDHQVLIQTFRMALFQVLEVILPTLQA